MNYFKKTSQLLSRHGKLIITPYWFIRDLPPFPLDGELWMGRGTFEKLMILLNSKDSNNDHWFNVGYYIFDLPASKDPYEIRMGQMQQLQLFSNHVQIVCGTKCCGNEHLQSFLSSIIEQGGEGLMVQNGQSLYSPNEITSLLLKIKVFIKS